MCCRNLYFIGMENDYQRRLSKCKAGNLCLSCLSTLDRKGQSCSACLKKRNARRKQLRIERLRVGICFCGQPATSGTTCDKCRAIAKRTQLKKYARRRKAKQCLLCGNPTTGSSSTCSSCKSRTLANTMSHYDTRTTNKQCVDCKQPLNVNRKLRRCSECHTGRMEYNRHNNRLRRLKVIEHYGGKCECCGESKPEFLEIDHINGNGKEHRGVVGRGIIGWIIRNNYPTDLRLLCANCNRGIGHYKTCPHKQEPAPLRGYSGRRSRRRRIETIQHYNGKCVQCGEANWAFLEFDHINNDGRLHRRQLIEHGERFGVDWIIKNNYPNSLQLLCANCNLAKSKSHTAVKRSDY